MLVMGVFLFAPYAITYAIQGMSSTLAVQQTMSTILQCFACSFPQTRAAAYLAREQIRVSHGSPAYVPTLDLVRMPAVEEIASTDEYYSTVFHELAHSTGHPHRLCRFGVDAGRFESQEDYSKEELVAEITSALLCHGCGVDSQSSIKNSAAYIQGWSRFIQEEGDAFLSAVNQAYKARAFILEEAGG